MDSSSSKSGPWWGKIGVIWLLFIPLCMAIYVLIQPLRPNDFWYHVRAGAWMVGHMQFPRFAMFTSSVPPHTPYFYQSWISEVLMFLTFHWTGLAGSQVLRAILFTLCAAIFVAVAQHRAKVLLQQPQSDAFNQAARRVVAVGVFGLFMTIPNTDFRPQTFSVPLFALFVALIFDWSQADRRQLLRRAALMIALMAFWANLHGAFALGIILLLLFCVAETAYALIGKKLAPLMGRTLDKTRLKIAWGTFIGSLLAVCINWRGVGLYSYVLNLTTNPFNEKYIQEWQRPTWSDGADSVFFLCGIAIVLMVALLAVRHFSAQKAEEKISRQAAKSTFGAFGLRPGELLIAAGLFVMGLRNIRSIIWFALLFSVVGAALASRVFAPRAPKVLSRVTTAAQRINVAIMAIFTLLIIAVLPWFKPFLPWSKDYKLRFATTPSPRFPHAPPLMLSKDTPLKAANFLRHSPPKKLLWNDMVFGSYLTWALYPSPLPWADPRIELRPNAFWITYLHACHGKNNPAKSLIKRGFSDALVDKNSKVDKGLIKNLSHSPRWKVAFEDRNSVLFRVKGD